MKKLSLITALFCVLATLSQAQNVITILEARAMPTGATVTVHGILTADRATMRWTGYMQDETGGIAFYNASTAPCATADSLQAGDIFTITGVLKDYNALLEVSPITSITIESRNNPLPSPALVAIPNITDDYESMLVKLSNVHFDAAQQGTVFTGGSSGQNYNVTDLSGNVTQIRVLPSTDIPGNLVPFGNVNITGCMGQYSPSNPLTGYQLLPRSFEDIFVVSSIKMTSVVNVTDITNNSVKLSWTTDNPGSSFVKYGHTASLELGTITGTDNTTDHTVTIPGSASELFYARAYSVSSTVSTDTAKSSVGAYITGSNSTGNIKVYFNTPVDNSVSTGANAITIGQAVDDTLISYINRAKQSIDIAIYNFNNDGISNISNALNSAANKGVNVRLIYCGTTSNLGIDELNSSIHLLEGPDTNNRDGIMHNKFMIIDALSSNANDAIVWTGSVNWTSDNMNTDANNVIIIQDQSLAKTYRVEFEEMWGSSTLTANSTNAKFGKNKTNNTPHQLKVGGKWLECYFSPSDNVNNEIINRITTCETDLEAAVMTFTRKEMAYAISDAVDAGADASFLATSFSNLLFTSGTTIDSSVYKTLKAACYQLGDYTGGGIMHNKYLIVDQANTASDPLVWTGSHNWTSSANTYNDENSIVIHDATVANLYYQNFVKLMSTADVLYGIGDAPAFRNEDVNIYPNPASDLVNINLAAARQAYLRIDLIDLSGRCIRSKSVAATPGDNHYTMDINGVRTGMYFVKVTGSQGSSVSKLLVE